MVLARAAGGVARSVCAGGRGAASRGNEHRPERRRAAAGVRGEQGAPDGPTLRPGCWRDNARRARRGSGGAASPRGGKMVARPQTRSPRRAHAGGVRDAPRASFPARSGALSVATRALLVSAEYPPMPGGIGDYTAMLAESLSDAGASVAVLTSASGGTTLNNPITVLPIVRRWN